MTYPLAHGLLGGRFVVEREVGRGGVGIVYRALDQVTGQERRAQDHRHCGRRRQRRGPLPSRRAAAGGAQPPGDRTSRGVRAARRWAALRGDGVARRRRRRPTAEAKAPHPQSVARGGRQRRGRASGSSRDGDRAPRREALERLPVEDRRRGGPADEARRLRRRIRGRRQAHAYGSDHRYPGVYGARASTRRHRGRLAAPISTASAPPSSR